MAKKQHNKTGSHGRREQTPPGHQGRRSKPFDWRKLGRRALIALAILAIPALVVGLEVRQNLKQSDLSVIGQGQPVLVQAHDPECPDCRSLLDNVETAHADFSDSVAFRVINLRTSDGRQFGREYDVGKVTLVVFDSDGEVENTLEGVRSVDELRRLFADLKRDAADS